MYCPQCGNDADNANFCPECGNDLAAVKAAREGRTRKQTPAAAPKKQRPRTARRAAQRHGEPARSGGTRSALWIWLGVAAIAIAVVAVVVAVGEQSGGGAASSAAEPIAADTSGSYSALVDRANGLYDQGIAAFSKDDSAAGEQYFKAAAEVYRAAWNKQPGEPSVGTDYAVALFYSRQHDAALQQIEKVIKKNPDFQPARLNQGIFLQTEASEAKQSGDEENASDFLTQARTALEKAVSIDPGSETGKRAAEQLQSL